jgi:site-specific DNA-methyltransferase (cytosine-N4-specific)
MKVLEYYTEESEPTGLLICSDAREALGSLAACSIQTVITSPPYWSLRDYGIEGQIGLTESLDDYLDSLSNVFDEVRRVLRDDGTLWLNIGDVYTSGNRRWRAPDKKNPHRAMSMRPPTPEGLKNKDLIGIPWRVAFRLQERGWYLRSEVIWRKPNAQPESVRDRPTREHEQVFLFSKSERYKYNIKAVQGPNERRLRTVWDIQTKARKITAGHFATFPDELVNNCILITSDEGDMVLDPFLGSGTVAEMAIKNKRKFVGIELNPDYVEMSARRLEETGILCERKSRRNERV